MKKNIKGKLALTMALTLTAATMLAGCGGGSGSASKETSAAPAAESAAESSAETEAAGETAAPAAEGEAVANTSDTLTWVLLSDIVSLDPTQAYDDVTNMVVNQITEGLLNFGDSNDIVNMLAESWECVDPTTYVYHIRSDIKFADGNPMTMEDVLWSIERNRDPEVASLVGWMFDSVDTIEQTGDWELTVKLKQADATWQYTFATTGGHVIEKAAYEADGTVVGTGAYQLDTWTNGSQIVLKRNENFSTVSDPVYFNKIVYNMISEDTTRVEALTTGQADFSLNPPIDMLPQLQASPTVDVLLYDTFGIDFLAMNTKKAPFDDVNVRKAIASVVDTDMIYESLLKDVCSQSNGVPFSSVLYDSAGGDAVWGGYSADKYPADMDAAKDFLSKSAYPDGFSCKLLVNEESLKNSEALYIQSQLATIGINVELQKVTNDELYSVQFGSTWDQANDCRDFDIGIFTWYADYPDASGNLVPNYITGNAGVGGSNTSGYSNAQVDDLLAQQLLLTDPTERGELMKQAVEIIGEEVPVIILDYPRQGALENVSLGQFPVNASYVWNIYARQMSRTTE